MKSAKSFFLACLLFAGIAHATPALVSGQNVAFSPSYSSATAFTATLSGVNPSSLATDFLIFSFMTTSATAPSSVVDSAGNTVQVAVAWAGDGTGLYQGTWYIADPTAGSHTITVNFAASEFGRASDLTEFSGVGAFDASSTLAFSGGSTSVTANSVTPAATGDLAFVALNALSSVSTWGSPLTGLTSGADAYGVLSSSSAYSATATLSASNSWAVTTALFTAASGGGSCAHKGFATNGTVSVPNGTSGTYILANGHTGTPDCSTISYCNTAGTCPIN